MVSAVPTLPHHLEVQPNKVSHMRSNNVKMQGLTLRDVDGTTYETKCKIVHRMVDRAKSFCVP